MDEHPMPAGPQDGQAPANNRPFGHAMTQRAQQVTVPIHDHTQEPAPPRAIPVQGADRAESDTELPIHRQNVGEDVA